MPARTDGSGDGSVVRLPARGRSAGEAPGPGPSTTRQRILKAAREIFFRDGFVDTNLDDVASRAEVGKGTLYRHFESKAELYVAVLAVGGVQFEEEMEAIIEDGAPALHRLRAIGRFYRHYWTEHPDHFVIFSAVEHRSFIGELPPPLLAEVREIWERPLRRLERVIADGVRTREFAACDPWVKANVIWRAGNAAVTALVTPKRSRVIDCSAEAIYSATLDTLLCGLVAAPDPVNAD